MSHQCDGGYKIEFNADELLVKEYVKLVRKWRRVDNVDIMQLIQTEQANTLC